ncbi:MULTISPECIES: hypothetical protein [Flavobacterium]|uniref:Uncharacterized protein n=1 Tax=Flavobacterium keumense TaxID=1306518 RepID=A0ABY8N330_9FLAO|nr:MULTISPECIES: hypothetical protein [Flavobacterium]WGK93784.1 hypothetical protein MG292_06685 [Flavobacterium keumense]
MANASNAYATISPIKANIGETIQGIEKMDFAYREEQRQIDALDQARKDKEQADLERRFKESKLSYSLTGYSNHDEPLIAFVDGPGGLAEQVMELDKQMQANPSDVSLKVKQNNIKKSIERINYLRQGVIAKGAELAKGLQDGTLSPYLNGTYAQDYNKLIGEIKYDYVLDDSGNVKVRFNGGSFDRDGDGIPDEFSLEDLNNPEKIGSFKKTFNENAWLTSTKSRYGKLEKKYNPDGTYITVETNGFDPKKIPSLSNEINDLLGENYSTMTDAAKSYIADTLKLDPKRFNETTFNDLKNKLKDKLLNSYDTKDFSTKNYQDENSDLDRAQRNNQFNRRLNFEKSKIKKGVSIGEIINTGIIKGGKDAKFNGASDGSLVYNIPDGGVNFSPSKTVNEVITDIYVNPKTKEVVMSGTKYYTDDMGAKKEKQITISSNKDQNKIGKYMMLMTDDNGNPFKSPKAFKKALLNRVNIKQSSSSSQIQFDQYGNIIE